MTFLFKTMKINSLNKKERIKSKKLINTLFTEGKSFKKSYFKVVYTENPNTDTPAIQIAVSVPKKLFKRAVKRNMLKRKIREAFRLNKHILYDFLTEKNIHLAIFFVYLNSEIKPYKSIEKHVVESLKKIKKDLDSK